MNEHAQAEDRRAQIQARLVSREYYKILGGQIAHSDVEWLLAELSRLSRAEQALRALVEEFRGYQAHSRQEARKAANQGDVAEQRSRQAEAAVLNVCIAELNGVLSASPEAQPEEGR